MAKDHSPWPTITFLGVLCGLALGAIALMLITRRRDQDLLPPGSMGLGDAGLDDLLPVPLPQARSPSRALARATNSRIVPQARTTEVSTTMPTMLLKAAGGKDWTVWVRNVGPPGSFATFIIGNDSANAVMVPAGSHQMMKLPRGEFLYARGDMPSTCVSVSGGPDY